MSLTHSRSGFCFACGAPTCMHRYEIDFKVSELNKLSGKFYDLREVDLGWLDGMLYDASRKYKLSSDKKCTCGSGYSVFCPEHGIYK